MENVPGMLSHGRKDLTPKVIQAFTRIGYQTAMYALDAVEFGVPQRRTRLFFVGTRKHSGYSVRDLLAPTAKLNLYHRGGYIEQPWHVTVQEALSDLPPLQNNHRLEVSIYRHRRGRPRTYPALMRAGLNGLLRDHVTRLHGDMDREAFRALRPGMKYGALDEELKRYRDDIFEDKYRKLAWDKPAGTITAHLAHDCYTHIHPSQARTISPREAARLQSFPDGFQFCGNVGDRYRQIGNAVPPLLAYRIAGAVLARLRRRDRRGR
jgi:DNA (cytosine-5)-methyltransferase 1